jgi:hypothetical protein
MDIVLVLFGCFLCSRPGRWEKDKVFSNVYIAGRLVQSDRVVSGKIAELHWEGSRLDNCFGTWIAGPGRYVWKTNVLW